MLFFSLCRPLLSRVTMMRFDLLCFVMWVGSVFLFLFSIFLSAPVFLLLSRVREQGSIVSLFSQPFFRQTASDSCAHHPVRLRAIEPGTKDTSSQASLPLLSAVIFAALFCSFCLFPSSFSQSAVTLLLVLPCQIFFIPLPITLFGPLLSWPPSLICSCITSCLSFIAVV